MVSRPVRPAVSVIVVVKNGERFLGDALRSALTQTLPPAEILVVDGRSTDGTARIVRSFPGVRHLIQPDDGLANARNLGIGAARHDLIAFLDHDDLWEPPKLATQVQRLLGSPPVEYTLTWMRFFLERGTRPPARFADGLLEVRREAATPSALVAHRSAFDRVGAFDSTLTIGCDADWFTRARDLGVSFAVIPEVLLRKRLHATNLSTDYSRNRREIFEVARRSIARQRRATESL